MELEEPSFLFDDEIVAEKVGKAIAWTFPRVTVRGATVTCEGPPEAMAIARARLSKIFGIETDSLAERPIH